MTSVLAQLLPPGLGADVLLEHGELGLDPPRLADVRGLGQPVLGADQVGPQPQALPAGLAVGAGALGLEPVEERQAELLGPGDVAGRPAAGVTPGPTSGPSQ